MEFLRVTNIAARRIYYENFDQKLERILSVLQQRGGASGRQIQSQLAEMDSAVDASQLVLAKRDAVMLAVPIYLGEDLSLLYQTSDEQITYVRKDDSGCSVLVEGVIVCSTETACDGLLALFMAHYIFNLEYSTNKLFWMFIQVVLMGMSTDCKTPAKLRSFIDKINA